MKLIAVLLIVLAVLCIASWLRTQAMKPLDKDKP
jgi:hypothetical protein